VIVLHRERIESRNRTKVSFRDINFRPIGIIHTPFQKLTDIPSQPCGARNVADPLNVYEPVAEDNVQLWRARFHQGSIHVNVTEEYGPRMTNADILDYTYDPGMCMTSIGSDSKIRPYHGWFPAHPPSGRFANMDNYKRNGTTTLFAAIERHRNDNARWCVFHCE
jgi:hypothetical protein